MKDWAWEKQECGNMLALLIAFRDAGDGYSWFKAMKLPHYTLYAGPFQNGENVAAFLAKNYYDELVAHFKDEARLSYGSDAHYVLLKPGVLWFCRVWGEDSTAASDGKILARLLQQDIDITHWAIEDFDFGNKWIEARGAASLKAYLAAG